MDSSTLSGPDHIGRPDNIDRGDYGFNLASVLKLSLARRAATARKEREHDKPVSSEQVMV